MSARRGHGRQGGLDVFVDLGWFELATRTSCFNPGGAREASPGRGVGLGLSLECTESLRPFIIGRRVFDEDPEYADSFLTEAEEGEKVLSS